MKKSILFIFALFPLLASCNNNEKGFIDPFPNDEYTPIGFTIASEGKIIRPLNNLETTTVSSTIEEARLNHLYKNIKEESIEIHERDYTRAFSGVFAQGYSVSNMKRDETQEIYRQDPAESNTITKLRKVTEVDSSTIYNFSYGNNEIKIDNTVYNYLAKKEGTTYNEDTSDYNCAFMQTYSGGESIGKDGAQELFPITTDTDIEPAFEISQADFIFNPSEATSIPGVNNENKVVLIKESHTPYKSDEEGAEEGIYELQDGRKYRATVNQLIVSQLKLVKPETNDDPQADWYIVDRSRRYIETTITSDVIQPNVPISYLKKPIVINYKEEIIKFNNELQATHTDTNPETMAEIAL